MKQNNVFLKLLMFPVGGLIIGMLIYNFFEYQKLRACHKIASGRITHIRGGKGFGTFAEYYVNGKRCTARGSFYKNKLPMKFIPVIYRCSDPDYGRVILTPSEFEEFNIPYPDSLKKYLPEIEN